MTKKSKKESKEEIEEEKEYMVKRAISIHTMNAGIELESEDPTDSLSEMTKIATKILDKYVR